MKLLLRHGTRTGFDAAGGGAFTNADTVLVTDPPALRTFAGDSSRWTEIPLAPDAAVDVSQWLEHEVHRIDGDLVVRLGNRAWRGEGGEAIAAVFPVLMGTRPVSTGRLTI